MAYKNYDMFSLQQKVNEVDNKAEQTYVDEKVNTINSSLDNYVTKVSGKGLSTNDFSNAYKTILDGLTTTINNAISTAIVNNNKTIYPIHSTKITFNNVNPGTYITGTTWELTAKGKTLVGVDTEDTDFNVAGKTGGNKTHAHDSGSLVADIGAIGNDTTSIAYNAVNPARTKYNLGITGGGISGTDSKNVNHATSVSGTTDSTSSLPPYITVYIWVRTA